MDGNSSNDENDDLVFDDGEPSFATTTAVTSERFEKEKGIASSSNPKTSCTLPYNSYGVG